MNRIIPLALFPALTTACKDPVVLESYLAIVHISPNDGAVNVSTDSAPMATFSETLDEGSITPLHAYLEDIDGVPVEAELSYDSTTSTITLEPIEPLLESESYAFVLTEGIEGIVSGLLLAEVRTDFSTGGQELNDDANRPPIANAGEDQTVALNDEVLLDGSLSTDMDEDELTYQWEFVELPADSLAEFDDSTLDAPVFTADVEGTYIIGLTVDDGQITSAVDYVQIFCE
jgi:hypothetical protein